MNLIALDVDGVLNSTRYWFDSGQRLPMGQAGAIDPAAVVRVNAIIEATGALVVLSSSWRMQGVDRVAAMLRERGFAGEIIGATPVKLGCPRCAEIAEWLWRFPFADVRCAILDDDADAWDDDGIAGARYFPTNYQVGLTDEHVPLVVAWLSGEWL